MRENSSKRLSKIMGLESINSKKREIINNVAKTQNKRPNWVMRTGKHIIVIMATHKFSLEAKE